MHNISACSSGSGSTAKHMYSVIKHLKNRRISQTIRSRSSAAAELQIVLPDNVSEVAALVGGDGAVEVLLVVGAGTGARLGDDAMMDADP